MSEFPFLSRKPRIDPSAWLASGSHVIGDVEIGKDVGLWYNVVARGDVNFIRIGEATNIQDLTMLHVTTGGHPLIIGSRATIGHGCVLHACTVEDLALVGMGSVVLDGAVIGRGSLIGAGSLVTQGAMIPPGVKVFGRPAKVVGELTQAERDYLSWSADHYVKLARAHRAISS